MSKRRIVCGLILLVLGAEAANTRAQASAAESQGAAPYRLSVSVDEVVLTFNASDAHGLPIRDLKLEELKLFDNGRPPGKIVDFRSLHDRPIRAGLLLDTSESVGTEISANRAIAARYTQRLLKQQTDRAFVMDFAALPQITQTWTNDPNAINAGLHRFIPVAGHLHGTALFDAVYRACLSQFGHMNQTDSGNVILLLSDGEDNASQASLQQAISECQHSNTAIYAVRSGVNSNFFSAGPRTLTDLAVESGGRVFTEAGPDAMIDKDLQIIEGDLRDQYRLIYKPADLKRDGSFHHVELQGPDRVDSIHIRSGYYAPLR